MSNYKRKPYKKIHDAEALIQAIIDMLVNNMTALKAEFEELKPREKFYFIERVLPAVNKFMEIERAYKPKDGAFDEKQSQIEMLMETLRTPTQKYAI